MSFIVRSLPPPSRYSVYEFARAELLQLIFTALPSKCAEIDAGAAGAESVEPMMGSCFALSSPSLSTAVTR